MAPHPQRNNEDGAEYHQKETTYDHVGGNSSTLLVGQQQSSSSTIPTFSTFGNRATGKGCQTIFAPMSQDVNVRHEKNIKHGKATQIIGMVDKILSLPQKQYNKEENLRGKKRFHFHTKGNLAVGHALQHIYAPEHQASNITHESNIAEHRTHQIIYKDQTSDPPATDPSEPISGLPPTSLPQTKKSKFSRRARSKKRKD